MSMPMLLYAGVAENVGQAGFIQATVSAFTLTFLDTQMASAADCAQLRQCAGHHAVLCCTEV